MSIEEFVRNRKELPSFGLHGTEARNVESILRSQEEIFIGNYFYCGKKERELPDDVYIKRLKASILESSGVALILLVNTNKEIREGLGDYGDFLEDHRDSSDKLYGTRIYYNTFFGCQTFPICRDPIITLKGGKIVELRGIILPITKLEQTYESVNKYAVSALELVYENIIDIKNSMK